MPKIIFPVILVLIGLILRRSSFFTKSKPTYSDSLPQVSKLKENDKIIIIKNTTYDNIKSAVERFCINYDMHASVISIAEMTNADLKITFPYDLQFDCFCFLINYLYYPENISYQADIKAWATVSKDNGWVTEQLAGKKTMLYIPTDDKEYDNIFLTTEDNVGYKIMFSKSSPKLLPVGGFVLYQQEGWHN